MGRPRRARGFRLTSAGIYTVMHAFAGGTGDGGYPGGLAQGTDGNFYGGTCSGGTNNEGVIYNMTPAGTVTLLHSFNLTSDLGENPQTNLLQANDGNFYSVAVGCNYFGCGSYGNIFEITPTGAYTTLQAFTFGNGAIRGRDWSSIRAVYFTDSPIGVARPGTVSSTA